MLEQILIDHDYGDSPVTLLNHQNSQVEVVCLQFFNFQSDNEKEHLFHVLSELPNLQRLQVRPDILQKSIRKVVDLSQSIRIYSHLNNEFPFYFALKNEIVWILTDARGFEGHYEQILSKFEETFVRGAQKHKLDHFRESLVSATKNEVEFNVSFDEGLQENMRRLLAFTLIGMLPHRSLIALFQQCIPSLKSGTIDEKEHSSLKKVESTTDLHQASSSTMRMVNFPWYITGETSVQRNMNEIEVIGELQDLNMPFINIPSYDDNFTGTSILTLPWEYF